MSEKSYYPVTATDEPMVLAKFDANVAESNAQAKKVYPQGRAATRQEMEYIKDFERAQRQWFANVWNYHADSWAASGFPELKTRLTKFLAELDEVIAIHEQTLKNAAQVDQDIAAYTNKIDSEIQALRQESFEQEKGMWKKMNDDWSRRFND